MHLVQPKIREDSNSRRVLLARDFSSYVRGNFSNFIQLFCRRQSNFVIGKSGFGNDSCSVMNGRHLLGQVLHLSNTRGQQNV